MQMGGIPIEIKKSTKFEAQSRSDQTNFDFLFQTLLFIDEGIPDEAHSVRFNVKLNNGQVTPIFHQTRNQKITPLNEKSFIVDVRSELWGKKIDSEQKIMAIRREYREANIMIDSEDPLIRYLAKNAAQGSKNILDLSQNLYRFAQKYIHHKSFNVGFATATETAKSREGDCTEHAVFLAALGRVHGIPTRVANGLVFMERFGNQKNVMGFHMWTEFHLNGKWHSLDSALGKMGVHADRITLSVSSLEQDSLLDIGIKLSEIIGNINVQVEKVSLRK
jgi:transglutaminase-like putative cysteine protease